MLTAGPVLVPSHRSSRLRTGLVAATAALTVAAMTPLAPADADPLVDPAILDEDARAPIATYLYDHVDGAGTPGAGFDELYARDPFDDERLLPGELCAHGPRGSQDAVCLDLAPEGFRFRGSSSRLLDKRSFNIRWDDRIQGPEAFTAYRDEDRGQSRLNANAMYTDPSMMRERLAMGMFETLGRPAPQTRHVTLHHNDVFEGLYTHVQRIDQNLVADLGLVTGGGSQRNNITLVRDQFRDAPDLPESMFGFDVRDLSDDELGELYATWFNWRRLPDEDDTDFTQVVDLHRWANEWVYGDAASQDRVFADEFAATFDVDVFLDWLAVHYLIGDIDSFGDDYWLLYNQFDDDPRWVVIPWDKDLAFGSHFRGGRFGSANDFFAYEYAVETDYDNELIRLVLEDPTLRGRFDARLRELMDEVFPLEYFETRTAAIASAIRDDVEVDPATPGAFERHPQNHHGELGRFDQHVASLLDFVQLRYAFLDRVLEPVDGPRDVATVDLDGARPGDRLALTDAAGFTLGWLDLQAATPASTEVTLEVSAAGHGDVDRRYRLVTDAGRVRGELTLFYRNEVESFLGAPAENWYREDTATGGQWDLVVATERGRNLVPLPSQANALSNRVTARGVAATPAGTTLRLTER